MTKSDSAIHKAIRMIKAIKGDDSDEYKRESIKIAKVRDTITGKRSTRILQNER